MQYYLVDGIIKWFSDLVVLFENDNWARIQFNFIPLLY